MISGMYPDLDERGRMAEAETGFDQHSAVRQRELLPLRDWEAERTLDL